MTDVAEDATDAWLIAGQALLRAGGIGAVKLRGLTELTGRTTGSFYHHFDGMAGFLDRLAGFYGGEQLARNLASITDPDPRVRIERAIVMARQEDMLRLDVAMRDWAGSSPEAARAVEIVDEKVLVFLATAFQELGYEGRSGEIRAQLLVSGGAARVMPPWRPRFPSVVDLMEVLAP